jgi:hypothetical protein
MRFLGRNWQKKNSGNGKGIRMSCFALRAAPVFGRAVTRLAFDAGLKASSNPKTNDGGRGNGKSKDTAVAETRFG